MNETITIVTGLPRSGTSMMMKMLEAGGMDVVTDNLRKADEDNPKGYYEFEKVKRIREDVSWLDEVQGKAVKMVSMLLFDLPLQRNYKLIFMRRDLGEVLASQRKMLERKNDLRDYSDEEMEVLLQKHLNKIERWIEQQESIRVLYLNYRDLIEDPRSGAYRLRVFLDTALNIDAMVQVVDQSLYRRRGTKRSAIGAVRGISEATEAEHERETIEEQLKSLGYM